MPSEIEPISMPRSRSSRRARSEAAPAHAPETPGVRALRTQLLSVPVIFIALVQQLDLPFAVYPSRREAGGWCFKFQRRFVLEVDAAGVANWDTMEPTLRPRLETALNQAVQLHAVRRRSRPRRRLAS